MNLTYEQMLHKKMDYMIVQLKVVSSEMRALLKESDALVAALERRKDRIDFSDNSFVSDKQQKLWSVESLLRSERGN